MVDLWDHIILSMHQKRPIHDFDPIDMDMYYKTKNV